VVLALCLGVLVHQNPLLSIFIFLRFHQNCQMPVFSLPLVESVDVALAYSSLVIFLMVNAVGFSGGLGGEILEVNSFYFLVSIVSSWFLGQYHYVLCVLLISLPSLC